MNAVTVGRVTVGLVGLLLAVAASGAWRLFWMIVAGAAVV